MKLEFDSIGELEQFLMFSAHIGKAFAPAPSHLAEDSRKDKATVSGNGASAESASLSSAGDPADAVADSSVPAEESATTAVIDKPARKRRTKAEMEAERTAERPEMHVSSPRPPIVELHSEPLAPQGNPFAIAPAMQAILDAPNQQAAALASMAALQAEITSTPTVHERALQILTEPARIESIAHLRACQGFIQKHGMPKYNESFTEGLNANIAIYSPEQRALHLAVLESLDA